MIEKREERGRRISLFKWSAFFILTLYMALMVLALIFCSFRKSHAAPLSMQTVQHIRMEAKNS